MKEIALSKYSVFFWISLLLTIVCAWFSTGYLQLDEHFQVIEFANCKLGKIPGSNMIWEYGSKVRATLLPWLVYSFLKICSFVGMNNPFTAMFILRLFMGIAAWYTNCFMCLFFLPKIKSQVAQKLFVMMITFLWFIPYLNVRFTSENISGLIFIWGVYLILKPMKKGTESILSYGLAGLLFGLSCFIRIQISFAVVGFMAWVLWAKKPGWKPLLAISGFGLLAIGINCLLDYFFYGQAVFTPYNYFYANIVQHMASSFGEEPFWFFFVEFILKVVPPLSLFLLFYFFTGIYKNLKDPLIWAVVPFVFIHFFVAHKELRFLFPVLFIFIYACTLGIDYWLQNKTYQRMHGAVVKISVFMCIPLLIYRTIYTSEPKVECCEYLYHNVNKQNTPLFVLSDIEIEFMLLDSCSTFYNNPNISYHGKKNYNEVANFVKLNKPETVFCVGNRNTGFNGEISGYRVTEAYCYIPEFILKNFNVNNWEQRTAIPAVYKLTRL